MFALGTLNGLARLPGMQLDRVLTSGARQKVKIRSHKLV